MKRIYLTFFIVIIAFACKPEKSKLQVVQEFYQASSEHDFNKIKQLTHDTITITEGTFKKAYGRQEYYSVFQWDSTFKPNYKIEFTEEADNRIFVKIISESERFKFLANNPLVTTHKISFTDGKISKIELIEYVGADFKLWVKKRDTLVNWTKQNHPEIDGFIYDMTKAGAENYLKAIEWFNNN